MWEFFEPATLEMVIDRLAAGTDANARDAFNSIPLQRAASITANPAIIAALLNASADANARNAASKIPWDYAKDREEPKGPDTCWRLNEGHFG
ncbi:MAG: hypothetical protein OXM87_01225 [Truepera sp.]|nr:hypothetical protein [Truepera sp.]